MPLTDKAGLVSVPAVPFQPNLFDGDSFGVEHVDTGRRALDDDSWVLLRRGWVRGSAALFEQLRHELPWRSVERPMYDRVVDVPRLICTVERGRLPSGHAMQVVASELERSLGGTFETIGVNLYRSGEDSVAWHRDRVGSARHSSLVALVSLGAPRTLAMRRYRHPETTPVTASTPATGADSTLRWRLGHGDLFVMGGACQRDWEHHVPKERSGGPRISLAFRSRCPAGGPRIGSAEVPPLWASHKLQ